MASSIKDQQTNSLRIGDTAPNFNAETTEGRLTFYDWAGSDWVILFSHPKDFTPVCTTEIGCAAKIKPAFDKRHVKLLALSINNLDSHQRWIKDINSSQQTEVNYPLIADEKGEIARLYGMLHPEASETWTVRTVFIIDSNKKIRATYAYPASTGRNFEEILRLVDSLQLTDSNSVATPANWKQGDECVILPKITDPEEIKRLFPQGYKEVLPYLRLTKIP